MSNFVQKAISSYSRTTSVHEILERNQCDPLDILAKIAVNDISSLNLTDNQLKYYGIKLMLEAACELAQYVYAKVKPREDESDLQDYAAAVLILPDNGTGT